MKIITTRLFWNYISLGSLFFSIGVAGIFVWFLRPDLFSVKAEVYFIGGIVLFIIAFYRLFRYPKDPEYLKADEKRFSDERWIAVEDKTTVFSFLFLLIVLGICGMYHEFICQELFGIIDPDVIFRIGRFFFYIVLAAIGVFFASLAYYYYFGRM